MFKKILFTISLCFLLSVISYGQSIDKISRRCKAPNSGVFGSILFNTNGDILQTPCPNKTNFFFGNVDFSGATVTGVVTGTGTAGTFPIWVSPSVLSNSHYTFLTGTYKWDNTTNNCVFCMTFTPSATSGVLTLGNTVNGIQLGSLAADLLVIGNSVGGVGNPAQGATIIVNNIGGGGDITLTPENGRVLTLGGGSGATTNKFTLSQFLGTSILETPVLDMATNNGVLKFLLFRTNTAGGTTGNQTINKPNGSVNIAAANSSIVITNSTVVTTSNILALAQTADATCAVKNAVPTANTITITMTANCTAETRVAFWVYN